MRLLRLDLGGHQIRNALAQQDFNGAHLGHGEVNFAKGELLKPIDKLAGADFFPDIIGLKEHFALGHLFCLLRASSTVAKLTCPFIFARTSLGWKGTSAEGPNISNLEPSAGRRPLQGDGW